LIFDHPYIHRFRKLEWLRTNSPLTSPFDNLSEYVAIKPLNPNNIAPFCMINEDIPEQLRLLKQDPWSALMHVWVEKMVEEENPLREITALFWHEHIPSTNGKLFDHGKLLLEIYREYGLGEVKELLIRIAANPAMMYFLDGHWSHKDNPNENFPRELLELFLLGEGNYTLKDVKEAARAFTGRRFDHDNYPYSKFIDQNAFDQGVKTIFGISGNFNGEDVIDLCLKQKQCAVHLTKAIISYFIAPNPSDNLLSEASNFYFKNKYHTGKLLSYLFQHPEVKLNHQWWGKKVKSPIELLVCFQRQTGLRIKGLKTLELLSDNMGQRLFNPPNVAGWPKDETWLNGNKSIYRLLSLKSILETSNREHPKNSINYKVKSRLVQYHLKSFRYNHDSQFKEDQLFDTLYHNKISLEHWLLQNHGNNHDLVTIVQNPIYQYHV
jgi:uncharacterized protein (DUF1800 family)